MGRHSVCQEIFLSHLLQRTPSRSSHDCVVPCTTSSSYLRDGMVTAMFTFPLIFSLPPTSMSGTMVIDLRSLALMMVPFRLDKHFTLDINGKVKVLPVFYHQVPPLPPLPPPHSPSLLTRNRACSPELTAPDEGLAHSPTPTKTGRVIRRPEHLADYLTDW